MDPITPSTIRYIKLGAGGSFAKSSLENGELQLGYHEVSHDLCAAGDWKGRIAIGRERDSGEGDRLQLVGDRQEHGADRRQ